MNTTLRHQINVPGICDSACLRKLKFMLSKFFTVNEDRIPTNMSFKAILERTDLPREVHLEVYTNNKVEIKASPEVTSFSAICNEIETVLREAVTVCSRNSTLRTQRAERILAYTQSISVNTEVERMIVVTLCDIILDLLVTEKLSSFTRKREDLENESVGVKLALLEKQYHVPVYRPNDIRDIRELRNKIAHGGASPVINEVSFARDTTIDIFELF